MNVYCILSVAAILLLAITGFLIASKTENRSDDIPQTCVDKHGLSPYSCRLEKDPVAARLADNAFQKSSYCFWNDINHYGGSKNLYYSSPEVLLHDLYSKLSIENKNLYSDLKDHELLSVLDWYIFMAWYINGEEVYGIYIDMADEFDFLNKDQFLGLSWISRNDCDPDPSLSRTLRWRYRPELAYEWKYNASEILEKEADIFEKSVRKFVGEKHNADN